MISIALLEGRVEVMIRFFVSTLAALVILHKIKSFMDPKADLRYSKRCTFLSLKVPSFKIFRGVLIPAVKAS